MYRSSPQRACPRQALGPRAALLLCALSFACARGTEELDLARFQRLTQSCPRSPVPGRDWLVSLGLGEDAAEARREASAELSRKISSELRSVLLVRSQERSSTRAGVEGEEVVREEITLSTSFEHGELIRPIQSCELCLNKPERSPRCLSWVSLQRSAAAETIRAEIRPLQQILEGSLARLAERPSLPTMQQAWRRIGEALPGWRAKLPQLQILGGMSEEEGGLIEELAEARSAREARLAGLRIYLLPLRLEEEGRREAPRLLEGGSADGDGGVLEAQLRGALGEAVSRLSLQLGEAARCPAQGAAAEEGLWVAPTAHIGCELGQVGPVCRLSGELAAGLCTQRGRALTEVSFGGRSFTGVHPARVEIARARLIERLKGPALPPLRSALLALFGPLLPLPQLL